MNHYVHCFQKILSPCNFANMNAAEVMTCFGHIKPMTLLQESPLVPASMKAKTDRLMAICALHPKTRFRDRLFKMIKKNNFQDDHLFDFCLNDHPAYLNIEELNPLEDLQLSLIGRQIDFPLVQAKANQSFYLGIIAAKTFSFEWNDDVFKRLGRSQDALQNDSLFWQNANQFLTGASLTQNSPYPIVQQFIQSLNREGSRHHHHHHHPHGYQFIG